MLPMEADGARDTAGARLLDPEMRVQHARDLAWKALNRRERTVAEMARLLAGKRVEPAVIDTVVGELCEQGYLDDASFAQRFAEDRRRLDRWGAERIERRLRGLGTGRGLLCAGGRALGRARGLGPAAVGCGGAATDLAPAAALPHRPSPAPPATP